MQGEGTGNEPGCWKQGGGIQEKEQSGRTLSLGPENLEGWRGDPEGSNRLQRKVRSSILAMMPVRHPGMSGRMTGLGVQG